jgi:hypothetical protein
MSGWLPIKRKSVKVEGADPAAPGLLDVYIELNETPPPEWEDFFSHPVGMEMSMSMHPPRLEGSDVHIRPPDKELKDYVTHVDQRIKAANERYEREVLPKHRAQETHRTKEQKRIDDAQKEADQL